MTSTISTTPPPEQEGPLLISIGLNWFMDKFTSGIHGYVAVTKEFGDYLRVLDPQEQHLHVEPSDKLALVYSRTTWLESVKRLDQSRQRAEADRQERFAREAKALELHRRYELREQQITRFTAILSQRASKFVAANTRKIVRMAVVNMLQGGGNLEVRKALGICDETVFEFKSLPQPLTQTEEELLLSLVEEKKEPQIL